MPELHISSLLLHVQPGHIEPVCARVLELGGEVHGASEQGKVIVTLESDHETHIGETLTALQLLPGVLAATLVFHQVEPADPEPPPATA